MLENPATDLNCKDDNGKTLIQVAIENFSHQTFENIKFLISKNIDLNITDSRGWSTLHFAA